MTQTNLGILSFEFVSCFVLRISCLIPVLTVGSVLVQSGCSPSGPTRYHLTGKVTLSGEPVPAGQIFFDPDIAKGNDGPAGFAFIKNGEFDTRLDGRQHIGGPHEIRIQAFDGKPGNELPLGRMMVPEFNTTAELPKSNGKQDFEIPKK
jgi:hypothetical protein